MELRENRATFKEGNFTYYTKIMVCRTNRFMYRKRCKGVTTFGSKYFSKITSSLGGVDFLKMVGCLLISEGGSGWESSNRNGYRSKNQHWI
jgi:hypothetical protein